MKTGMAAGNYQNRIGTHLRSLGFLVLIAILVLQFIAPSVSAATQSSEMAHHEMADHSAHSMMQHAASGEMDADKQNSDCPHETAVRCMPTMCCFQETSAPFSLVAVGLLLPSNTLVEQAIALPSHTRVPKDRPPQHI